MQLMRPHMAAEPCTRPLLGSCVISGIGNRCCPSVSEVNGTTSTVSAFASRLLSELEIATQWRSFPSLPSRLARRINAVAGFKRVWCFRYRSADPLSADPLRSLLLRLQLVIDQRAGGAVRVRSEADAAALVGPR